jgi:hypothetical protein
VVNAAEPASGAGAFQQRETLAAAANSDPWRLMKQSVLADVDRPLPQPTRDLAELKADLDVHGYCFIANALNAQDVEALRARSAEQYFHAATLFSDLENHGAHSLVDAMRLAGDLLAARQNRLKAVCERHDCRPSGITIASLTSASGKLFMDHAGHNMVVALDMRLKK